MGAQKEQSNFLHLLQWANICHDEEQCATPHNLPDLHDSMWLRTFLMVRQWGRVHCNVR